MARTAGKKVEGNWTVSAKTGKQIKRGGAAEAALMADPKFAKAQAGMADVPRVTKSRGASNQGKWSRYAKAHGIPASEFCGPAGGVAGAYTFPVFDPAHERAALSRAHFAPNPEGIRACVARHRKAAKKPAAKKSKKGSKK